MCRTTRACPRSAGRSCWPSSCAASAARSAPSATASTASARINYRPLEKLLLPPPWHRGRAILIGDAAHATTPHLASGAGLAVEDALVLGECLASEHGA